MKMVDKFTKAKLKIIFVVFIISFSGLVARAFQFQVIDREKIKLKSDETMTVNIKSPAIRGTITDRNGEILAMSVLSYYVVIGRGYSGNSDEEVEKIIRIIEEKCPTCDGNAIREKMKKSKLQNVTVIDKLPAEEAQELLRVSHSNLGLYPTESRVYPNGQLASHIIGFLRSDGVGQYGLEREFERELKGVDGYYRAKTDPYGRKLALSDSSESKAINGSTIKSTIDITIQYFVEQAITLARKENKAKAIMAIVQDSKTGEILAMSSNPTFDPNNPREIIDDELKKIYDEASNIEEKSAILEKMWRNPNISDVYEPGSTFKILTGAAGIEEGLVNKNTTFRCGGFNTIDNFNISCWIRPGSHGKINLIDGFKQSCNVVFMDIAFMLGKDRMYEYIDLFNLNKKTGISLPAESNSLLVPRNKVKKVDLARISFGHSVTFTPLQMMNILMTISNDGELVLPSIVKSVKSPEENLENSISIKEKKGKILSTQTVQNIKDMLELVVEEGTGRNAKIKGYRIGGKTGTSTKIVDGKYQDDLTLSSFAAIVPIEEPRFNILVVVDEPKGENISGSRAAAPIAKEIIYNTINYLKIEPEEFVVSEVFALDNCIGMSLEDLEKYVEKNKLVLEIINSDSNKIDDKSKVYVKKQYPIGGTMISIGDVLSITLDILR